MTFFDLRLCLFLPDFDRQAKSNRLRQESPDSGQGSRTEKLTRNLMNIVPFFLVLARSINIMRALESDWKHTKKGEIIKLSTIVLYLPSVPCKEGKFVDTLRRHLETALLHFSLYIYINLSVKLEIIRGQRINIPSRGKTSLVLKSCSTISKSLEWNHEDDDERKSVRLLWVCFSTPKKCVNKHLS